MAAVERPGFSFAIAALETPFQHNLRRGFAAQRGVLAESLVVAVGDFPAQPVEQLNRVEFERAFAVRVFVGHTVSATSLLFEVLQR